MSNVAPPGALSLPRYRVWSLLAFVTCGLAAAPAQAADPNEFDVYNYDFASNGTVEVPGRLFVPDNYDASRSYPIVLFYHGAGQVGSDNEIQVRYNIDKLFAAAKARGFFLYAPQLASGGGGTWNSAVVNNVFRMVSNATRDYNIDLSRIYVTGLSLGGLGTWNSLMKYGHILAGAVPICGGNPNVNPLRYDLLVGKPIWAFHAADDMQTGAPVTNTRNSVNKIREADGLPFLSFPQPYVNGEYFYDFHELRYTEFATGGHEIWNNKVYILGAMYDWLLSKRNPLEEASLQPGETMLFDFGNIVVTMDAQGRRWNGVSANYHRTLGAVIPFGFTSGGFGTSVSLDVDQAFGGHTTNGSTALYPTNIGTDGWQTAVNTAGKILIRGLIPGAAYQLKCYGSTSNAGRNTRYQVGSVFADLNATSNTTATAVLSPVVADSQGWIALSVSAVPGSGSSQGQINTLELTALSRALFAQDFSSSTNVSDYVHPTAPNSGQVNDISAETGGGTWSIDAGRLKLVRNGTSTAGAGMTRFTGPIAQAPDVAQFHFKVSLSGVNTSNDLATVELGNVTSLADYNNNVPSAAMASVLTIKGRGNGVFGFVLGAIAGSYTANGTDVEVSWMLNQSASSQTYRGLDGSLRTLSPGRSDVWVGTTLLFGNVARTYGSDGVKLGGFRIRSATNQPVTFTFDDFGFYGYLPQ